MNIKPRSFLWWIIFILLCIWQLPQFLVAIVMLPFLGHKVKVADRHFNFCFCAKRMSGGISLGPFAFVSEYSNTPEVIAHETDGHTVDSKLWGPLYLFVIGIPSILWAWLYDYKKRCYYDFYTEKRANRFAGLVVSDRCRLKFSDK